MKVQCQVCKDFVLASEEKEDLKPGNFTCFACSLKEKINKMEGFDGNN